MKPTSYLNRIRLILIFAIFLIALFLRGWAAHSLPTDHDEFVYLNASRYYGHAVKHGMPYKVLTYEENYEHPAFSKIIYGLSMMNLTLVIPEKSEFMIMTRPEDPQMFALQNRARMVSAFFGALGAGLLAVVNPLAGLLLAVHSFSIKYTSVVYLESIPFLASLAAVLAYARWQSSQVSNPLSQPKRRWLVLSSLGLGIAAASKYMYAVAGIAILIHMLWDGFRRKRHWKSLILIPLAWGSLSLFFFFIADPALWLHPIQHLTDSIQFNIQFSNSEYVKSYGYPFWQPLVWLSKSVQQHADGDIPTWDRCFLFALDLPISLLAILGIPRLIRRRPIIAVWLLTCLFFLLIWDTKWPQYVMIILAPLCYSAGEGLNMILIEPAAHLIRRVWAKHHPIRQPG